MTYQRLFDFDSTTTKILIAAFIALLLTACGVEDTINDPTDDTRRADIASVSLVDGETFWLPEFVTPEPYSGYLGNPQIGNQITFKTLYTTWRALEPVRGEYNWDIIENAILKAQAGGYRLILRIHGVTLGGQNEDGSIVVNNSVPDWVMTDFAPPTDTLGWLFNLEVIPGWRPDIRDAFNELIREFGRQGFPQRAEIGGAYISGISPSRGEEFWMEEDTVSRLEGTLGFSRVACTEWIRSRMNAYVEAFSGLDRLVWVGDMSSFDISGYSGMAAELMQYAWNLGIGNRHGIIERYHNMANDPSYGQAVNEEGYMTLDETVPPIATLRYFGSENEEYGTDWEWRYGSVTGDRNRYRLAMFRALQMRLRFLLTSEAAEALIPPLSEYARRSFGKDVWNSPDAWALLKETPVKPGYSSAGVLKNFERWLRQRDLPGGMTVPTERVDRTFDAGASPTDQWYDYMARRTDVDEGSPYIYFDLDDRILVNGPVEIRVEYVDRTPAVWHIDYVDGQGNVRASPAVINHNDGELRTAIIYLPDIVFVNAFDEGMDFRIVADGPENVVVRWVRVIRDVL